jgi:RES domain-containing protein
MALASANLVTLSGPWFRCIDHDYLTRPPPTSPSAGKPEPLWPGGAKAFGGRFTPKGSFDTLYLSSESDTALLEVESIFKTPKGAIVPGNKNPVTIVQVLGTLTAVLDLTDSQNAKHLKTDESELTGPWRTITDPLTHRLGRAAEASGRILALKSFSAKNKHEGTIVAVFTDHLMRHGPSFVEVVDSTGKLNQRLP